MDLEMVTWHILALLVLIFLDSMMVCSCYIREYAVICCLVESSVACHFSWQYLCKWFLVANTCDLPSVAAVALQRGPHSPVAIGRTRGQGSCSERMGCWAWYVAGRLRDSCDCSHAWVSRNCFKGSNEDPQFTGHQQRYREGFSCKPFLGNCEAGKRQRSTFQTIQASGGPGGIMGSCWSGGNQER